MLMKSVEGKKRGKDPFLYWVGRDLKKPSFGPCLHRGTSPTGRHQSIYKYTWIQMYTKTHRHTHTQKDTQRHKHIHTEGTHTDTHMRTSDISLGNTGWLSQPSHSS